jgi:DNA-binding MarR family transcriptional regulator
MSEPYNLSNYTPEQSVGFLLKRVTNMLTSAVDRALVDYDMTHVQMGIIFKILHCRAHTAADFARELMTDTSAITRTLDRMEEKGLIQRQRSSSDRRIVEVELTEKSRNFADQMTPVVISVLNQHLHDFSPEEIDLFKSFLLRMIANGEIAHAKQSTEKK